VTGTLPRLPGFSRGEKVNRDGFSSPCYPGDVQRVAAPLAAPLAVPLDLDHQLPPEALGPSSRRVGPRLRLVFDAGRYWAVKSIAGAATASTERLENQGQIVSHVG
jgi:hypothetical protein